MTDDLRSSGGIGRFVLFQFRHYYPSGGWFDRTASFATQEAAEEAAKQADDPEDHWHIVDMTTGKIISGDGSPGYGG